jgi:hypothetical protein
MGDIVDFSPIIAICYAASCALGVSDHFLAPLSGPPPLDKSTGRDRLGFGGLWHESGSSQHPRTILTLLMSKARTQSGRLVLE